MKDLLRFFREVNSGAAGRQMILVLFFAVNFYYIAILLDRGMHLLNCYISELYLYVVAQNVGYMKRFAGL